ncbi:unsaturated glucuronyl hydrolase-like [Oppia nitens]|uniref:unsaturated glucuronyl hydrolase-like n=1 Tax=Oppia nitens TaxID=1686743 RepID=UPI0023DB3BED|nr:unsaturated glucuronyl hydrolase-like [Oppia nitens]
MRVLFVLQIFLVFTITLILCLDKNQLIQYSVKQYNKLDVDIKIGVQYPTDGKPISTKWHTTPGVNNQWTAGFYPGVLWYLFNYTKDDHWKHLAIQATDGLFANQFRSDTHDIGFMIQCSYGKGYEFTTNSTYPNIIANAAHSLAKRFNHKVGCIRSWGSIDDKKQFLVIVDNMMNLELLFKGYEITGNKTLYDMAVSHANRTLKEHVRKDNSSYHIVNFNVTTGQVIRRYQGQGYNDSSTWARGQAWLINGFTTTYGFTKLKIFLDAAEGLANYYINNLPEDSIALWDFNVPKDKYPYIPRDTSSAAIAASGLFDLYGHTKNNKYLKTAKQIMESLASSKYRADGKPVYNLPALILNATIAGPNADPGKSDLAIIYGDYYFMNALKYYQ